jgi:hypothetical protein
VIKTYQSSIIFVVISKKMRKSSLFKRESEDRENCMIYMFLNIMNNYLKIDMIELFKEFWIRDLVLFLENDALCEYHHHIKDHDLFASYDAVKKWLIEYYSSSDSVNMIYDHFFACLQKEDKFFKDYHYQFTETKNLLDSSLLDI